MRFLKRSRRDVAIWLLSAFAISLVAPVADFLIPPANAYTNSFIVCGGGESSSGKTIATQNLGCTTQAYVTLIVAMIICSNPQAGGVGSGIQPYSSSPSNQVIKITDSSGNSWSRASIVMQTFGWDIEAWFTDAIKSTPNTDSVSVFFTVVPNNCSIVFYQADTYAYLLNNAAPAAQLYCISGCTAPVVGVKKATLNLGASTPANSMVFEAGVVNGTFGGGAGWTLDSSMSTVRTQDWGAGIQYAVGGVFQNAKTAAAYTATWAWSTGSGHVFAAAVAIVFSSQSGSKPPSCVQCTKIIGGNASTTTTGITRFFLKSNTTVLYPFSTTTGALLFQNITAKVSGVVLSGGQTSAKVTLGLYMVGNQANLSSGSLSPISSAIPLNALVTRTWTVTAATTNKTISFIPNYQVQNNTQYAITLSTSHDGVRFYETGTVITMQQDTADGYNPATISSFSSFTPALFLAAQVILQQYVTTSSVTVSSQTTVFSTTGAVINAPDPSNGNWAVQFIWVFLTLAAVLGISVMIEIPGSALLVFTTLITSLSFSLASYAQLMPFPFSVVSWISTIFSFFMVRDNEGVV